MTNYFNSVISILTMTPERSNGHSQEDADFIANKNFWQQQLKEADEERRKDDQTLENYTYKEFTSKSKGRGKNGEKRKRRDPVTVELVAPDPEGPFTQIDEGKGIQGPIDAMAWEALGETDPNYYENFIDHLRKNSK